MSRRRSNKASPNRARDTPVLGGRAWKLAQEILNAREGRRCWWGGKWRNSGNGRARPSRARAARCRQTARCARICTSGECTGGKELGQTANLQPTMLRMIKEKEAPASISPLRPPMGTTRNLRGSVGNQKTIEDSQGVHAKLTPTANLWPFATRGTSEITDILVFTSKNRSEKKLPTSPVMS